MLAKADTIENSNEFRHEINIPMFNRELNKKTPLFGKTHIGALVDALDISRRHICRRNRICKIPSEELQ